jgi:hypothetical protein
VVRLVIEPSSPGARLAGAGFKQDRDVHAASLAGQAGLDGEAGDKAQERDAGHDEGT